MADITASMVTRLRADTAVSAIVGQRVFRGMAPQTATLPMVICFRSGGGPLEAMEQDLGTERVTFAVYSFAATGAAARTLGDAVKDALQDWHDPDATAAIQACHLEDDAEDVDSPVDASEQPPHVVIQRYVIWTP